MENAYLAQKLFASRPFFAMLIFLSSFVQNVQAETAVKANDKGDRQEEIWNVAGSISAPPRSVQELLSALAAASSFNNVNNELRAKADARHEERPEIEAWRFYRQRSRDASAIGRFDQALEDLRTAYANAGNVPVKKGRRELMRELALAENEAGNFSKAIDIMTLAQKEMWNSVGNAEVMSQILASVGDLRAAKTFAESTIKLDENSHGALNSDPPAEWRAPSAHYILLEAEGSWAQAEGFIRSSIEAYQHSSMKGDSPGLWVEKRLLHLAINLTRQNRFVEADGLTRDVILRFLRKVGRANIDTVQALLVFSEVLLTRGRLGEAEVVAKAVNEILKELELSTSTRTSRLTRHLLGRIAVRQGNWSAALKHFDTSVLGLSEDDYFFRHLYSQNVDAIIALSESGRTNDAERLAHSLLAERRRLFSEQSAEVAEARMLLGFVLAKMKRNPEATENFNPALIVLDRLNHTSIDKARLSKMIEGYLEVLLSDSKGERGHHEAFLMAQIDTSTDLSSAIKAMTLRNAVSDNQNAQMIRLEQDLDLRAAAIRGHLSRLMATSSDITIKAVTAKLKDDLANNQAELESLRQNIARAMPFLSNFSKHKRHSVDAIQGNLRLDEVAICFFLGDSAGHVWTVQKSGLVRYARIPAGRDEISRLVTSVRKSVEFQGDSVNSIPAFDMASADKLYKLLLEPVKDGWKDAKSLIIVPDGPLGFLPFALLPTETPTQLADKGGLFDHYRQVKWLGRSHALSSVPSVASFVSLRKMQAAKSSRKEFAGFGNPIFSEKQSDAQQVATVVNRGAIHRRSTRDTGQGNLDSSAIVSARLENLVALPETADEVRGIARTLGADEEKDVFLGRAASEEIVMSTQLSDRKVVMFATHGLVAGDLDGLNQPALALSNPAVVGGKGDGLLTLEKVLGLKLDADWVVLSACNTAAADGTGAEAVSGLGRAFFYAGTRALLVSHWPVETESAKAITTELFRRQSQNPALSRGEALRQAMTSVMDGPGLVSNGKTIATYAHPVFWAPFTLVGDGG
ncbi:MAG: CHAT domain-containing protein [Alphaproteobacteria bacterium]|nr:CHAT domain-containing protein [Alphaproteobacteria bacterium]